MNAWPAVIFAIFAVFLSTGWATRPEVRTPLPGNVNSTSGTISPDGVLRLKAEPEQDGVIYRMATNRVTLTCEVRGTVGQPYTASGLLCRTTLSGAVK